jgi:hypothetical protein
MKKEHFYTCAVTFGNMSTLETEGMRQNVKAFLSIFGLSDEEIRKVPYDEGAPSESFYHLEVCYQCNNNLRVQRFAECILAFCLHQGIALHEFASK